jgi:hypothetical protein
MGQYHKIINLDTNEGLYSHALGSGLKLLEQGSDGFGGPTSALALLIAPRAPWHGAHLAVCGDYEEPGDLPNHAWPKSYDEEYKEDVEGWYHCAKDEPTTSKALSLIGEAFGIAKDKGRGWWEESTFDAQRIINLATNVADDPTFGPLYVCNLDKGQYLDPHDFGCGRNLAAIALKASSVAGALFIALAVSNGRGGGDLHVDHPIIGSWGGDRIALAQPEADWLNVSPAIKEALIASGEAGTGTDWAWDSAGNWVLGGPAPAWLTKLAAEQAPAEVGVQGTLF